MGEDERSRLVAHLGPAAGWMIPKGVLGWSHEVSVVAREALTEQVRRDAKIVMPDEQIPPAKLPLTHQAALKSPLVAVSSRLTQKLVDAGIRVHTIGADRVTSSFYYIAEGGGEAQIRVEGDLVAAVGAMLGDRADNAAIDRVLDGLVDRLLRSLSKDRVSEVSLELAAALPRAAADGSGTADVDLDAFEKELGALTATSDKYTPLLREIAAKISDTNDRRVDIPLYGDARKVSQGPFELTVGDQKVGLVTHERWLATGPLTEPTRTPAAAPPPKAEPRPEPKPEPKAERRPDPTPQPKAATPRPAETKAAAAPSATAAASATAAPSNIKPLAAPLNPPRPTTEPPREAAPVESAPAPAPKPEPAPAEPAKVEAPKAEPVKAEEPPKAEPVKAEEPPKAAEPAPAATEPEPVKAKEPAPKEPAPKESTAKEPKASPAAPVGKEKAIEERPRAKAAPAASTKLAETSGTKPAKGGIPWLWILVGLAAAFAAYRFLLKH